MPKLDFVTNAHQAFEQLLSQAPSIKIALASSAPVLMLLVLIVIHGVYYRSHVRTDGQQVIKIHDLTNLSQGHNLAQRTDFSVFEARRIEINAMTGLTSACELPYNAHDVSKDGGLYLFLKSKRFKNGQFRGRMIFGEDMIIDGETSFIEPVKVCGDLIVNGKVTFHEIVVINGNLKIKGQAHFAKGLIAKQDALVSGSIIVGSQEEEGWAIVRDFILANKLKLNGRIISNQKFEILKAA